MSTSLVFSLLFSWFLAWSKTGQTDSMDLPNPYILSHPCMKVMSDVFIIKVIDMLDSKDFPLSSANFGQDIYVIDSFSLC